MTIKVLYEYSVLGDDRYDYIESFEHDYHPSVSVNAAQKWMRPKFIDKLLKRGIIVDKIKELC